MSPRKAIPTKQSKNLERPPFTPDDIVRAIDGVEKAGFDIYSVEISLTGDIKITTGPRKAKSPAPSDTSADDHDPLAALIRKR